MANGFPTRVPRPSTGARRVSPVNGVGNCASICAGIKLDSYLTPLATVNLKWN